MKNEIYKILLEEFYKISEVKSINLTRYYQLIEVSDILQNHFMIDEIRFLETGSSQSWADGCVGYYFGRLVQEIGGSIVSVDNKEDIYNKSVLFYSENFKNVNIKNVLKDSVEFIKEDTETYNLVYLDSWDLDLVNPFPSMLHTWREFESLKDRIDVGGLIIIDDNYYGNSWVTWNTFSGGKIIKTDRIDITYPIIGKGTLIYHYCEDEKNGWKILSKDKSHGLKKLVIQKIK